ncbi:homeobox protein Hox-D13a [Pygocentrus nattereri]|uniref:Homeobox domain-containing protein n=1 Tax=Pygocentrus nattereri TaxID=42514 RepID=A0A3B4CWR9_PYGNA|nr:homeobox protein Hox-D13a [Pygocentrus nattereri]
MELEELGGETASVANRSFYPAFGQQSNRSSSGAAVYPLSEGTSSLSPECFTPYVSFPSSATGANTQVTFGCHFASSCYTCKAPPSAAFQQSGVSHGANGNVGGHSADKQDTVGFGRAALRCGEVPGRVRDLGVYQGYTGPYSYPRIPGYIDVPVAQRPRTRDQRRESHFAVEGYQPWNWSSSWNGQVYCPKEQTQSSHIWKSSLTEDTALSRSDPRRVRKKRVPYTKLQLKELEHEYTITKFITKERRRRIASSTNLSERQVTIWFQNRRVKDKKIISKISKDFEPYQ